MSSMCGASPEPSELQATVQRDSVLSEVNQSQNCQKPPSPPLVRGHSFIQVEKHSFERTLTKLRSFGKSCYQRCW